MSKSRPYIAKDGNRYSDIYERDAANKKYEQQKKLIEEQQKANRLIKEQNERIKNGGYTDNEKLFNEGIKLAKDEQRIAPLFCILCLIIAPILIFSTIDITMGLYILAVGLLIEVISAYIYNKKNNINHFFELSLLVVCLIIILLTILPISVLKQFLPIENKTYTITSSKYRFSVNKDFPTYGDKENLDINEDIKIIVEPEKNSSITKTIEFSPKQYFDEIEKETTIGQINNLYTIDISEILKINGDD